MSHITTLISDGTSLRMPFRGGEISLFFDGTFRSTPGADSEDIINLFRALDTPDGGRVWWKIFSANSAFRKSESEYIKIADALYFGTNENAVSKNPELVDWILESEIYRYLSFSVFYDSKKYFWDWTSKQGRTDRISKDLWKHIKKFPNSSRATLKQIATR